ncbi:MAG: hypothetical protein ACYTFD_04635 [Planctomycetota bacterium]
MRRWEGAALMAVFGLLGLGVYLARAQPDAFERRYVVEDGPIEWLTVLVLLGGAAVCFGRLRRGDGWRHRAGTLVLALLFLFGAGEELSWGQRFLGVESPAFFKEHNLQGETNLHNLVVGGVKINKLLFSTVLGAALALYFFVLPVLYRRVGAVRAWADRWALPVARWHHVAAFAVVVGLVELMPSARRWEALEFGGCAVFLLLTARPLNTRAPA